jgi:quercetin dioxygenase-like cupin family protein
MAILHLLSGEVVNVRPLGDELDQTSTNAFFKDPHLEVVRVFLPAGKCMAEHAVDWPITVQCIEGEVDVVTGDTHKVIHSDDLLYLAGGVRHELLAIRKSSLLVTIVLLRASDRPGAASERRMDHDDALEKK